MESINSTQIILLPKIAKPNSLLQFRPTSLCTVLYKIIVKSVANRFETMLEKCIDKFILKKLITNNVLLICEIMYTFKNSRSGRKGLFALKLDMSKVYVKVEWNFRREMMMQLSE